MLERHSGRCKAGAGSARGGALAEPPRPSCGRAFAGAHGGPGRRMAALAGAWRPWPVRSAALACALSGPGLCAPQGRVVRVGGTRGALGGPRRCVGGPAGALCGPSRCAQAASADARRPLRCARRPLRCVWRPRRRARRPLRCVWRPRRRVWRPRRRVWRPRRRVWRPRRRVWRPRRCVWRPCRRAWRPRPRAWRPRRCVWLGACGGPGPPGLVDRTCCLLRLLGERPRCTEGEP
jgi:hypothetical protein